MRRIQRSLDALLEQKIISGYNYFPTILPKESLNLTLSNYHETGAYLLGIVEELENLKLLSNTSFHLRKKEGITKWDPQFRIRDDLGNLLKLKIRDGFKYLDLESIKFSTLKEAGFKEDYIRNLIGENQGYEVSFCSKDLESIKFLANLFLVKSDEKNENSWKDAYDTPIIIIRGKINTDVDGFLRAIYLKYRRDYEYSFITKEDFDKSKIMDLNIKQEICFINSLFYYKQLNHKS